MNAADVWHIGESGTPAVREEKIRPGTMARELLAIQRCPARPRPPAHAFEPGRHEGEPGLATRIMRALRATGGMTALQLEAELEVGPRLIAKELEFMLARGEAAEAGGKWRATR